MQLRRATPEDAGAIAAGHVASWQAAYRGLMPDAYLDALSVEDRAAQWRGSLEREELRGKRTFVVEAEHRRLIGYATVGQDEQPDRGLLLLMYVLEEAWGTGVGRALLGAAHNALRELGYSAAVLWVLERNERARRFYEAAGWRADGERQTHDYGGAQLEAIRYAITL
jgi:RimJ/RimL family protein N-acetyltransferase